MDEMEKYLPALAAVSWMVLKEKRLRLQLPA
jgi:hypothetical protein